MHTFTRHVLPGTRHSPRHREYPSEQNRQHSSFPGALFLGEKPSKKQGE